MTTAEVITFLKARFTNYKFYNESINAAEQCIGVYVRGSAEPHVALGGKSNQSYGIIPMQLLVHGSEDAGVTQTIANTVYDSLYCLSDFLIGTKRVASLRMKDSHPIGIGRDKNNVFEMTFSFDLIYDL